MARIVVDASAWTGRSEYADDLNVLFPPRPALEWIMERACKNFRWLPIPAILIYSGYRADMDDRGWRFGLFLCPWRKLGEHRWWVLDSGSYRKGWR